MKQDKVARPRTRLPEAGCYGVETTVPGTSPEGRHLGRYVLSRGAVVQMVLPEKNRQDDTRNAPLLRVATMVGNVPMGMRAFASYRGTSPWMSPDDPRREACNAEADELTRVIAEHDKNLFVVMKQHAEPTVKLAGRLHAVGIQATRAGQLLPSIELYNQQNVLGTSPSGLISATLFEEVHD